MAFRIGITGKARAGKDTLAWALVDALRRHGIDARRYGWADALKAVCRVEHGMVGKDARLLQHVGLAYRQGMRARDYVPLSERDETARLSTPQVWVDALVAQLEEDAPDVAIIADMRFPNEVAAVHALVRIARPDRPDSGRDDAHVSETALDAVTAQVTVNNVEGIAAMPQLAHVVASRVLPLALFRRYRGVD